MTTGEKIRDLKRPYRKKSFQSGYSQKGSAVQSNRFHHIRPYQLRQHRWRDRV